MRNKKDNPMNVRGMNPESIFSFSRLKPEFSSGKSAKFSLSLQKQQKKNVIAPTKSLLRLAQSLIKDKELKDKSKLRDEEKTKHIGRYGDIQYEIRNQLNLLGKKQIQEIQVQNIQDNQGKIFLQQKNEGNKKISNELQSKQMKKFSKRQLKQSGQLTKMQTKGQNEMKQQQKNSYKNWYMKKNNINGVQKAQKVSEFSKEFQSYISQSMERFDQKFKKLGKVVKVKKKKTSPTLGKINSIKEISSEVCSEIQKSQDQFMKIDNLPEQNEENVQKIGNKYNLQFQTTKEQKYKKQQQGQGQEVNSGYSLNIQDEFQTSLPQSSLLQQQNYLMIPSQVGQMEKMELQEWRERPRIQFFNSLLQRENVSENIEFQKNAISVIQNRYTSEYIQLEINQDLEKLQNEDYLSHQKGQKMLGIQIKKQKQFELQSYLKFENLYEQKALQKINQIIDCVDESNLHILEKNLSWNHLLDESDSKGNILRIEQMNVDLNEISNCQIMILEDDDEQN